MNARSAVVSLHIAVAAAASVVSVGEIQAIAGKGLEGDRYFLKTGTFSKTPGSGREVTLIEVEAIEALRRDAAQARRNIVTRGLALNDLIDRDFAVGEAVLRGTRLCDPCAHLEKLTVKGVMRGLIHRGGLRAEVVRGGTIRVGDVISTASE